MNGKRLIVGIVIGVFMLLISGIMAGLESAAGGYSVPPDAQFLYQAATPTPTQIPAGSPNTDWTPIIQEFDGVEMVLVPAGCFMLGSTEDEIAALNEEGDMNLAPEGPQHEVCFEESFWIDRTEVTNGQFKALDGQVMRGSGTMEDERPRDQITWTEATDFCTSRGARLPTEAEWEYAARGPEAWEFPWGNEFDESMVIWSQHSRMGTGSVGSLAAGASWVGALDMSGNVWEWVADWYAEDSYTNLEDGVINPTGPADGLYRVLRGGSWADNQEVVMRAAYRNSALPSYWSNVNGFRCVRSG